MLTKSTACTCIIMWHALVVFRMGGGLLPGFPLSVIIVSLTVRLG